MLPIGRLRPRPGGGKLSTTGPASTPAGAVGSPEALAREFEPRIEYFANQVAREFMLGARWRDELESAGYWGLAQALTRRRHGACDGEVSAYVSQRIRGAILDEARRCLRRTRWLDESGSRSDGRVEDGYSDAPPRSFAGPLPDPGRSPEEIAGRHRLRQRVNEALESLGRDDRVLLRAYMHGLTLAEIARRKGVPPGTLRARFDRLMRRLREPGSPMRRMGLDPTG
jgi:RNA polymerase sigma factor (sigma-70 family)